MTERRRWGSAALLAGLAVAVVRRRASWGRDEYSIWPDEPAQLAIARFVGGGTRWNMDDHSVWRPLFGTLLAPAHWFTDDPVTVLHVALTLNAVLGGLAAVVLVYLARRLTPLTPWWSAAAVVVVSLVPATLFTAEFVFAESLVGVLFLVALLALVCFHEAPSATRGVIAAVAAAMAFGAHSRMLPLTVIVLGAVGLAALRRRVSVPAAVLVGAVTVVTVVLVEGYTAFIVERLWDQPSTRNSPAGVIEQLGAGAPVLVSLIGQVWYQLVATLGVVVYGVVVLAQRARSSPDDRLAGDARVVLVTTAACVALSVVFMADRWRSDQLVYGRYNDAVVGPLVLVGLAVLLGSIPLPRLLQVAATAAGTTLGLGVGLWVLRRDLFEDSNGLEPMILGLQPFVSTSTSIDVIGISIGAGAITVGLAVIAVIAVRREHPRPVLVFAAVVALVAVGTSRTSTILDRRWDDAGSLSAVQQLRRGPLADGVAVDFHLPPGSTATNRMMLYQFYLPHTEFTVVNGPDDATSPLVFARLDAEAFSDEPVRLIWVDPRGSYGLYRR
jgi:hypothetical protein